MKQLMHVLYTFLGSTMHTTVQGHQPDMEQTQEYFHPVKKIFPDCSIYNLALLNKKVVNRKLSRFLRHLIQHRLV